MPKYKVEIRFGYSTAFGEVEAESAADAKQKVLDQLKFSFFKAEQEE